MNESQVEREKNQEEFSKKKRNLELGKLEFLRIFKIQKKINCRNFGNFGEF